jgi:hypothetical protein
MGAQSSIATQPFPAKPTKERNPTVTTDYTNNPIELCRLAIAINHRNDHPSRLIVARDSVFVDPASAMYDAIEANAVNHPHDVQPAVIQLEALIETNETGSHYQLCTSDAKLRPLEDATGPVVVMIVIDCSAAQLDKPLHANTIASFAERLHQAVNDDRREAMNYANEGGSNVMAVPRMAPYEINYVVIGEPAPN